MITENEMLTYEITKKSREISKLCKQLGVVSLKIRCTPNENRCWIMAFDGNDEPIIDCRVDNLDECFPDIMDGRYNDEL